MNVSLMMPIVGFSLCLEGPKKGNVGCNSGVHPDLCK